MERTFGVEIEFVGIDNHKAVRALRAVGLEADVTPYNHNLMTIWKVLSDASVHSTNRTGDGWEAVSPILSGEAGKKAAVAAANALKTAGGVCNKSCGTHCHMGIRDLDLNDIKTIMRRYAAFETEIDAFMPPSRRGNNNTYCKSIRPFVASSRFQSARTIRELIEAQGNRYFKVNLQSINRHGTLEFRQHNGIVDADRLLIWIRFLSAFITESVRIARSGQESAVATAPIAAPAAASRLTSAQQRLLDRIRQPGGATAETLASALNIRIHSARAVVTRIRQAGYNVRVVRRNGETRYEVAGDVAPAAASVPPSHSAAPQADSLMAGIDEDVAEFYRQRAAVLAIA